MSNEQRQDQLNQRLRSLTEESREIENQLNQIAKNFKDKASDKVLTTTLLTAGALGGIWLVRRVIRKKSVEKVKYETPQSTLTKQTYNNSLYQMIKNEMALFVLSIAREKIIDFLNNIKR